MNCTRCATGPTSDYGCSGNFKLRDVFKCDGGRRCAHNPATEHRREMDEWNAKHGEMTDIGDFSITCEVVITRKEYQCCVGGEVVLKLLCKLVKGEAGLCWTCCVWIGGYVVLGCSLCMHSAIMVLEGDSD